MLLSKRLIFSHGFSVLVALYFSLAITNSYAAADIDTGTTKAIQHNKNEISAANLLSRVSINKPLSKSHERQNLDRVNRYFNRYATGDDATLWGTKEYWATPQELLTVGAGDCEDVAIAKFYTLLKMGVSEDRLRFAYVKAYNASKQSIEDHLVLLYREQNNNNFLVLDNLTDTISARANRTDLIYQYAFNQQGWWSMNASISNMQIARSGVIKSWRKFLQKVH